MNYKKLLSFLLVLLSAVLFLSGCGEKEKPSLPVLKEDGGFLYTVVRSDTASGDVTQAAQTLKKAIVTISGLSADQVGLDSDWIRNETEEEINGRYEILVGKTNRAASTAALGELGEEEYLIRLSEDKKKILLLGIDDEHTVLAVRAFLTDYLGYRFFAENGKAEKGIVLPMEFNEKKTGTFVPIDYSSSAILVDSPEPFVADVIASEEKYAVDPTGETDSTAGIGKALNDCAKMGGGTVYLPEGKYLVKDTVSVPAFVSLHGARNEKGENLTLILAAPDASGATGTGLFRIGGSAGIDGIDVLYTDQNAKDPKQYPPTFYIPGGSGADYMVQTVRNVTVYNGYIGIASTTDGSVHEQLYIENFRGTFLKTALLLHNSADVGTCKGIRVSPEYWLSLPEHPDESELKTYLKKNAVGLTLADLDWSMFTDISITCCRTGVKTVQGKRSSFTGTFYGLNVTDSLTAVEIGYTDVRWGVEIAASHLEGEEYSVVNKTSGVVRLAGVEAAGKLTGTILYNEESLAAYPPAVSVLRYQPAKNLYPFTEGKGKGTDISAPLQLVLDEAGKKGGIVYLPAGVYTLKKPVKVPEGVELRGASDVATRVEDGKSGGTVLLVRCGVNGSPADQAAITLGKNAGITGMSVCYPDNGATVGKSSYAIRGEGSGCYAENLCLMCPGYGIDFSGCDGHFVKMISSFCYYNDLKLGGKNGYVSDFLHNATIPVRRDTALFSFPDGSDFGSFLNSSLKNNVSIILDGAENETLLHIFSYGVNEMIRSSNSTGTLVQHVGTDGMTDGYQFHLIDGDLRAINAMRCGGNSVMQEGGTLNVHNRMKLSDPYEGEIRGKEIPKSTELTETDPVMILNCDNGLNGLSADKNEKTQGSGSAYYKLGSSANMMSVNVLSKKVDCSTCDTLAIDLWISDPKTVKTGAFIVEMTSSGQCDVKEYEWEFQFGHYEPLHNGWNTFYFLFDEAKCTGGDIDLRAVNFIRIFDFYDAALNGNEFRIDNIRACTTGGMDLDAMGVGLIHGNETLPGLSVK
ncbi:MAG: glycoside hydrolase family 55 protein [Lachnospiraceae bacterium]|nr:glycoside hydrolase family 55 protein [Lachnospiraceae bacterium]